MNNYLIFLLLSIFLLGLVKNYKIEYDTFVDDMNLPDWHPIQKQDNTVQKEAIDKVQNNLNPTTPAVKEEDKKQNQVNKLVMQQAAVQKATATQSPVIQPVQTQASVVQQKQVNANQMITDQTNAAMEQTKIAVNQKSENGITTTSEQKALPAPQQPAAITNNTVNTESTALKSAEKGINLPAVNLNLPVNISLKKM